MMLLAGLMLPWAVAFFAIGWCWPEARRLRAHLLFKLSLSAGLGIGLSSCSYFLWAVLLSPGRPGFVVAESALYIVMLIGLVVVSARQHQPPPKNQAPADLSIRWQRLVWLGFVATVVVGLVAAATWMVLRPYGEWDAFAIWNFHARFIYRADAHWTDYLTYDTYGHADYPLLLSGSVARLWTYAGREGTFEPRLLAALLLLATCGLLGSVLANLRSHTQGMLAVMVLAGTSLFIEKGAAQCADVPIGFFFLATGVLLFLFDQPGRRLHLAALAGAAAGFAAWTKNEGVLWILAMLVARFIVVLRTHGLRAWLRELGVFALGMAPGLCCLVYLKLRLAPTNDLIAGQGLGPTLERMFSPGRYLQIAGAYLGYALLIGPATIVILAVYAFLVGKGPNREHRAGLVSLVIMLGLMLAGYAVVFLTTPHDLPWHLGALDRLLLQLWPVGLFAFFLWVRTPEELFKTGERGHRAKPNPPAPSLIMEGGKEATL
jgi:hypothetical protein